MPLTENLRPGVYSNYVIDSAYAPGRSGKSAALAINGPPSLAGTVYSFSGYESAILLLGVLEGGERPLQCVRILLESGVSVVHLSVIDGDLADALELLAEEDQIGVLICEAATTGDFSALRLHLANCADAGQERVAFLGAASVGDAISSAQSLNDERAVLCCPAASPGANIDADAVYSAAAMAGAIAAQSDPAHNWNGEELTPLASCSKLSEADIQSLIGAGVTVLEERGGAVSCIRAVTTRTASGGVADYSMRSLNTILIIDDVMSTVRDSLKARLRGVRVSLDTVKSQVTVELSNKQDSGIIQSFSVPVVRSDPADSSVCLVEISFQVAHVFSQIHITAHVRI